MVAGDFMDAHNELTEKMEVAARRPHGQPLREFLGREAFDEIVALQEALAENSFSHLLPLMGLASGHTSLDDKVHALMYALHHEVGSLPGFARGGTEGGCLHDRLGDGERHRRSPSSGSGQVVPLLAGGHQLVRWE